MAKARRKNSTSASEPTAPAASARSVVRQFLAEGKITRAEVATAEHVAEIYGRYERLHGPKRSRVSPAYLVGYFSSGEAAEGERNPELEAAWRKLQDEAKASLRELYADYRAHGEPKVYALYAIELCAKYQIPIPWWAADDFRWALTLWSLGEAGSLDEAFEAPRVKIDKHDELALEIFNAVERRRQDQQLDKKDRSLGEGMWEAIKEELGVSSWSQCRTLYYRKRHELDRLRVISKNIA